eukprot:COSAG02_NODE_60366_length_271_cov_0.912791_1_plen_21_part_10
MSVRGGGVARASNMHDFNLGR